MFVDLSSRCEYFNTLRHFKSCLFSNGRITDKENQWMQVRGSFSSHLILLTQPIFHATYFLPPTPPFFPTYITLLLTDTGLSSFLKYCAVCTHTNLGATANSTQVMSLVAMVIQLGNHCSSIVGIWRKASLTTTLCLTCISAFSMLL